EEGEPRLGVDRREQALERLAEVRVAEVVEAGPAASGREEASGSERDEPPPHRVRPGAGARPRAPTSVATPWSCQATSPGTPSETSRTRFTSERASATSGPSPKSLPRTRKPPSWTPSAPGTVNAAVRTDSARLSITTAAARPTGCPRKRSASQISP